MPSVLHRRASEWYEASGLIAEAVNHALAAGDVERVARLVAGNALAMLDRGELTTLVGLLDALSDNVVRTRPWLCVAHAWALVYAGRLEVVEPRLQDAERALLEVLDLRAGFDEQADDPAFGQAEGQHTAGHIAAIRAYISWLKGDISHTVELARRALELLPERDLMARGFVWSLLASALRWSGDLEAATQAYTEASAISQAAGDTHIAVNVLCDLGAQQKSQGQLHRAVSTWRAALRLADEYARQGGRQLAVTGNVYALMSGVLLEWNDPEAALRCAIEGAQLCEQGGWADVVAEGHICLAAAFLAIGDCDGAQNAIQKALRIGGGFWFGLYAEALEARLRLAQGDVAAAARWAQENGLDVDDALSFHYAFLYRTLARVLFAQGRGEPGRRDPGRLAEASQLLARVLEVEEAAGAMGHAIEILVSQAMALQARGRVDEALTVLERALSLAEPEGYVHTFVGKGAPMAALLRTAASRGVAARPGVARDYVGRLLAAFGGAVPSPSPLIEPLSERELEVLRLLAAGLSNREIAAELFLAVGTVKKHTSNIYGKLGVRSRARAVVRARELGLV
jgi:LuxR family maltose regulon positive regulatory protein